MDATLPEGIEIRCCDCLSPEGLPSLVDGCAAAVVADTPYNIGKDFGNDSDRMESGQFLRWQRAVLRECWRVLMPGAALYWFCSQWYMARIERLFLRTGFTIQNRIVWGYDNGPRNATTHLPYAWEPLFLASKGERLRVHNEVRDGAQWRGSGARRGFIQKRNKSGTVTTTHLNPDGRRITDLWQIPRLAGSAGLDLAHESPKPEELYRRMLLASTDPGDLVVSPCLGTGPEATAASILGRRLVGYEINPDYVEIAKRRLRQQRLIL